MFLPKLFALLSMKEFRFAQIVFAWCVSPGAFRPVRFARCVSPGRFRPGVFRPDPFRPVRFARCVSPGSVSPGLISPGSVIGVCNEIVNWHNIKIITVTFNLYSKIERR